LLRDAGHKAWTLLFDGREADPGQDVVYQVVSFHRHFTQHFECTVVGSIGPIANGLHND
jgi:hypothetical protein